MVDPPPPAEHTADHEDAAPDLGPLPNLPGLDSPLAAHNGGPGLVFPLLMALKAHVAPLGKDNPFEVRGQVRYRFRGIDDLYNHLHQLLGAFGLLFAPAGVVEVRRSVFETPSKYDGAPPSRANHVALIQRYTWVAADGSMLAVEMPGEGLDAGDKGTGKALSMAHKYGLVQSLALPTGEPDGDAFLTEGAPAPAVVTSDAVVEQRAAEPSPRTSGGPAPSAPLGAERHPFRSVDEARATIRAAKSPGELPGLRRRIFDSVHAKHISGGDANTLMSELESHTTRKGTK